MELYSAASTPRLSTDTLLSLSTMGCRAWLAEAPGSFDLYSQRRIWALATSLKKDDRVETIIPGVTNLLVVLKQIPEDAVQITGWSLNFASKHVSSIRTITIGDPIPIMKNGKFILDNVLKSRNKIDIVTITSQLHSLGINSFEEVRYAQIEPSGQLSVITKDASMFSVLLIKTGEIRQQGLEIIEKDEEWLTERLAEKNIEVDNVFLGEFWDGKLMLHLNDGSKTTA